MLKLVNPMGDVAAGALVLALCSGCQKDSNSAIAGRLGKPSNASAPLHTASNALVDRVWVRSDSTGLPGVMRIFLSDGTLVMDSCWETYRLSRWQMDADSTVRWQEDGADIRATVRSLNDKDLVLRVRLVHGSEEQHYRAASVPYVCPDMKR